jgi:hypothetical protein
MLILQRALIMVSVLLTTCWQYANAANTGMIWDVQPDECVVSQNQEFCDTTLLVTLLKKSLIDPCVYIDDRWIGCFDIDKGSLSLPIIIQSDVELRLADGDENILAQHTIDYRLMQSKQQRRRIRLPWSVF